MTEQDQNDRLRAALGWALNYISDGFEQPKHDCEYISNPEAGECTFCREYWGGRQALSQEPKP